MANVDGEDAEEVILPFAGDDDSGEVDYDIEAEYNALDAEASAFVKDPEPVSSAATAPAPASVAAPAPTEPAKAAGVRRPDADLEEGEIGTGPSAVSTAAKRARVGGTETGPAAAATPVLPSTGIPTVRTVGSAGRPAAGPSARPVPPTRILERPPHAPRLPPPGAGYGPPGRPYDGFAPPQRPPYGGMDYPPAPYRPMRPVPMQFDPFHGGGGGGGGPGMGMGWHAPPFAGYGPPGYPMPPRAPFYGDGFDDPGWGAPHPHQPPYRPMPPPPHQQPYPPQLRQAAPPMPMPMPMRAARPPNDRPPEITIPPVRTVHRNDDRARAAPDASAKAPPADSTSSAVPVPTTRTVTARAASTSTPTAAPASAPAPAPAASARPSAPPVASAAAPAPKRTAAPPAAAAAPVAAPVPVRPASSRPASSTVEVLDLDASVSVATLLLHFQEFGVVLRTRKEGPTWRIEFQDPTAAVRCRRKYHKTLIADQRVRIEVIEGA